MIGENCVSLEQSLIDFEHCDLTPQRRGRDSKFVTQASIPSLEDLGKGQELGVLKWLGSEAEEESAQGGWAVHVAVPGHATTKERGDLLLLLGSRIFHLCFDLFYPSWFPKSLLLFCCYFSSGYHHLLHHHHHRTAQRSLLYKQKQ